MKTLKILILIIGAAVFLAGALLYELLSGDLNDAKGDLNA
jgi:hypothetical protein